MNQEEEYAAERMSYSGGQGSCATCLAWIGLLAFFVITALVLLSLLLGVSGVV